MDLARGGRERYSSAYFIRRETFPETTPMTTTTMSTLACQKLLLRRDTSLPRCETGADIVLSNYLSKPQKTARFSGRDRSSSKVRSARGYGTDSRIRFACCSPLIITDNSDRKSNSRLSRRETCCVTSFVRAIDFDHSDRIRSWILQPGHLDNRPFDQFVLCGSRYIIISAFRHAPREDAITPEIIRRCEKR